MLRKFFCVIGLFLSFVPNGLSEEPKEDTLRAYYLDEVLVTATRTEKAVKDISATVSVVGKEEIEASGANSCTDILNTLPGLFVQKTGAFGRADADIRGIGGSGRMVMVLIDGRPEKMGLYGCTITHSLPLDNVERIEVVRGPLSVLYGSDALGGVINIITKRAKKKIEGDLTASYGTYSTHQYRVRQGGDLGKLDYYLTGDWRLSDGHLLNSAYNGKDFSGRLGCEITNNIGVAFTSKYFDGYKEEPLRATDPDTLVSDVWNDYERGALDLSFDGEWRAVRGLAKFYRNFGEHRFSDGWHSKDFTNGALLHSSAKLFFNNELTTGVEVRHQGGERISEPKGEWGKKEYAVFLHNELRCIGEKAILTFGSRYNYDEIAGSELCPQVGLVFRLMKGTIVRGLANKGFRAPQINELYMFLISNDKLKPERVWNYEIGLSHQIVEGIHLELVGYTMKGDNIIQLEKNLSPPPMFKFQNAGEFEFKGIEAGANIQIGNKFNGRSYYTYLDPGEKTGGRPGDKFDLVMRYSEQKFIFSIAGQYVTDYFAADSSKEEIDDYFVANTKVIYKFLHKFHISLGIDNLLDTEYEIYVDLPGGAAGLYQMPGRAFTFGANLEY